MSDRLNHGATEWLQGVCVLSLRFVGQELREMEKKEALRAAAVSLKVGV